jgi:cellobiose-specific phosphotransferase system component IIC
MTICTVLENHEILAHQERLGTQDVTYIVLALCIIIATTAIYFSFIRKTAHTHDAKH